MKHCASRKRRLVLFCGWILLTSFAKSNLTGKHCSIGVEARENSQRTVTILRTRSPRRRWMMPAWLCDGKKKVVKLVQVVAWLRSVIFDESWNRLSAKGYCLNRFWNPRVYVFISIFHVSCIYIRSRRVPCPTALCLVDSPRGSSPWEYHPRVLQRLLPPQS